LETDDSISTIDKLKNEQTKLYNKRSKILDLFAEEIIDKDSLSIKIDEINKDIKKNEIALYDSDKKMPQF